MGDERTDRVRCRVWDHEARSARPFDDIEGDAASGTGSDGRVLSGSGTQEAGLGGAYIAAPPNSRSEEAGAGEIGVVEPMDGAKDAPSSPRSSPSPRRPRRLSWMFPHPPSAGLTCICAALERLHLLQRKNSPTAITRRRATPPSAAPTTVPTGVLLEDGDCKVPLGMLVDVGVLDDEN